MPFNPVDRTVPEKALLHLQIVDVSTSSKPDNYRISPASATASASNSNFQSVWEDWSGRGGTHVEFLRDEILPLKKGRFLGHGINGGVWETVIAGQAFAWKQIFRKRKITDADLKEIQILKKLSHTHIIRLVGTYTHCQFLGLLLYPVAVCDLATFFEDFETMGILGAEEDPARNDRFSRLGVPFESFEPSHKAKLRQYIFSKIGCLAGAVEYLHQQKVRHKDLKPSNVLLSANGLWLTDFGTATDFSLLSTSATENCERGTPKYFAPEVATYAASGRAADIFSLGCVLLEIAVLFLFGTLQPLQELRPCLDKSFQANLDQIDNWFSTFRAPTYRRVQHLTLEIRHMIAKNPDDRPSAAEVCSTMGVIDGFLKEHEGSLFGKCCRISLMPVSEHEEKMSALSEITLRRIHTTEAMYQSELRALEGQYSDMETRLRQMQDEFKMRENAIHPKHQSPRRGSVRRYFEPASTIEGKADQSLVEKEVTDECHLAQIAKIAEAYQTKMIPLEDKYARARN